MGNRPFNKLCPIPKTPPQKQRPWGNGLGGSGKAAQPIQGKHKPRRTAAPVLPLWQGRVIPFPGKPQWENAPHHRQALHQPKPNKQKQRPQQWPPSQPDRSQATAQRTQPTKPALPKKSFMSVPRASKMWSLCRWLAPLVLLAALIFVLMFTAFGISATVTWPYSKWRSHAAELQSSQKLIDAGGRTVGVSRGSTVRSIYEPGRTVAPISAAELPPIFSKLLIAGEDKRFGQAPCWILGVDFCALAARAALLKSGGSTLVMQLSSNLSGMKADEEKLRQQARSTWSPLAWMKWKLHVVQRKAAEIALAPQILMAFCGARIDQSAYRDCIVPVYASHAPFGIRAGGTIYGAAEASQALWQQDISQISPGKAAVLASLPDHQVLIYPKDHPMSEEADKRWVTKIVPRARRIAAQAFPNPHDLMRVQIERELDLLELQVPHATNAVFGIQVGAAAGSSLHGRREALISSVAAAADKESKEIQNLSSFPGALQLTVDAKANDRYKQAVEAGLEIALNRLRLNLCVDITGANQNFRPAAFCPAAAVTADASVFGALTENGSIKGMYSSRTGLIDVRVAIGSVAKLLAVMLVAEEDAPESKWCTDPSCAAAITAMQAIAISDSRAVLQRMQQVDKNRITAIAQDIGFSLATHADDPRWIVANGMVEASPRQLLELISCLAAVSYGFHPSAVPHVISRAKVGERWLVVDHKDSTMCKIVGSYVHSERAKHFVRSVLSAVTQTGTMRFVGVGLGKTGTPTSSVIPGQPAQAKLAVGAYPTPSGWRAYVVTVHAPWVTPLGTNLRAADFRELIRASAGLPPD